MPIPATVDPSYTHKSISPNLFLAPAKQDNLDKTIKQSVSLENIQRFLSNNDIKALQSHYNNPDFLHCWAMTESRRSVFINMKEGDIVLLTTTGSGKFEYYGEIAFKTDNKALGDYLWERDHDKP